VPADRERFTLTVEALPDDVPAAVRLRSLLKRALRSFRLRCVSVAPAAKTSATATAQDPEQEDQP
jgi:hypothetical protein